MFITKKHLSRRTFLRGAGVAVGLPFLDAMVPAWTVLAQTAAAPKPRMGFMYLPHGAIMEHWTPAAEGTNFELSPILQPFTPFKKWRVRSHLRVQLRLDDFLPISNDAAADGIRSAQAVRAALRAG
jgi:hypothetical protein